MANEPAMLTLVQKPEGAIEAGVVVGPPVGMKFEDQTRMRRVVRLFDVRQSATEKLVVAGVLVKQIVRHVQKELYVVSVDASKREEQRLAQF